MPESTSLLLNGLFFVLGLLIIIKGSDLFLDNAIWIARASGLPQIVIGATIVSVCTTMPELVSSCTAALQGSPDMALGNAIGSVICNSGFILGMVLLFITARVDRHTFAIRGIFLLLTLLLAFFVALPPPRVASLLAWGSTENFAISRLSGLLLLLVMVAYVGTNYYESSRHGLGVVSVPVDDTTPAGGGRGRSQWVRRLALFAAGGILVGIGAFLLVTFGRRLARNLGVGEAVISLVFVAFGTSLPELFTAISAVKKRAEQISVGNILGANVMNVSLVTGVSALITPLEFADKMLIRLDIPVAFFLCGLVFVEGLTVGKVGRKTGIVLLTVYVMYLGSMLLLKRVV